MKIDLKYKLIIISILIGLVPLITNSGLTYDVGKDSTEKQILSQLISIADLKEDSLNAWLLEEVDDLKAQSKDFELVLFLMNKGLSNVSKLGISNNLNVLKEAHPHKRAFVTDSFGKIIFSTEDEEVGNILNENYIQSPLKTSEFHIEKISKSAQGPVMFFSEPIFAFNFDKNLKTNEIIGILVLEVNLEEEIFSELGQWPGRGETGEILIVRKEGEEILFLNELRHKKNTSLNFRIPIDSEFAKPAIFASQGDEGILKTFDYRGEEVLSAYRNINIMNWGLVVKMDATEAFEDVVFLRNRVYLISAILLFVVIFFSVFSSIVVTKIERKKTDQLERFVKVIVGREEKMVELKNEIKRLGRKKRKNE